MIARMAGLLIAAILVLPANAHGTPTIKAEHAGFDRHLTDGSGVSIYLFEEDRGEGNQRGSSQSSCVGDCSLLWPPVPGDPLPAVGKGVDARLIGSFRRPDGQVQATYNGWPLYYFAEDFVAGDINGHHFEEFGGDWYLVTPAGREVGGMLALGVDYAGEEDCGCQGTDAQNSDVASTAPAVGSKTSLAARFASAFLPDDQTPGPSAVADSLAVHLSTLASTQ
jgi:predicted lipoprotein with Yx(FWY)xxD motif